MTWARRRRIRPPPSSPCTTTHPAPSSSLMTQHHASRAITAEISREWVKTSRFHGWTQISAVLNDATEDPQDPRPAGSIVIVEACLQDHQVIDDHPVDEAVLLVYPSRPDIAGTMFEPFRLTATVCGIAHRVIDEDVDAFEKSTVVDLPLLAVVPPGWVKDQLASSA